MTRLTLKTAFKHLDLTPTRPLDFSEMIWLFQSSKQNRGIARLNLDEAALLWQTVKSTEGPILEIGRFQAGSTVLLSAAAGSRQVVSVDIDPNHHPAADQFLKQPSIRNNVELLTADSRIPLHGRQFGMIFIDGDHTYKGVTSDILAHWGELTSFGGKPPLMAFHDAIPKLIANEQPEIQDNLETKVRALREMLMDSLGNGVYDNAISEMVKLATGDRIASSKLVLEFERLPELQSQKEEEGERNITYACHKLLESGVAKHYARATSMLVLEKVEEINEGFFSEIAG